MTTSTAMDINTFCPVTEKLSTREKDGGTWIVLNEQLRNALQLKFDHRLYLPQSDWEETDTHDVTDLISEAGLYKLVFASEAPKASRFKAWVLDVAIPEFVTMTGDLELLIRNEEIRYGEGNASSSLAVITAELIPAFREVPDCFEDQS